MMVQRLPATSRIFPHIGCVPGLREKMGEGIGDLAKSFDCERLSLLPLTTSQLQKQQTEKPIYS